MATITEDYVSFETAKLLKKKGFNYPCRAVYSPKGVVRHYLKEEVYAHHLKGHKKLCPTLQMAMKWLREVHNIGIFPSKYTHIADRKTIRSYGTAIINLKTYELMTDSYLSNDTYEDAVEAAIKYCLENLI